MDPSFSQHSLVVPLVLTIIIINITDVFITITIREFRVQQIVFIQELNPFIFEQLRLLYYFIRFDCHQWQTNEFQSQILGHYRFFLFEQYSRICLPTFFLELDTTDASLFSLQTEEVDF